MNEKTRKSLSIIQIILTAIWIVMCVWALIMSPGINNGMLCDIIAIAALLMAMVYLIKGYKKDAAIYYHLFMIIFTLSVLADSVFNAKNYDFNYLAITAYGVLCILCVAENLGKKKSTILGLIVLVCLAASLIMTLIKTPGILRGGDAITTQMVIREGATFTMAIILNIMIIAKYKDKEARGTK